MPQAPAMAAILKAEFVESEASSPQRGRGETGGHALGAPNQSCSRDGRETLGPRPVPFTPVYAVLPEASPDVARTT